MYSVLDSSELNEGILTECFQTVPRDGAIEVCRQARIYSNVCPHYCGGDLRFDIGVEDGSGIYYALLH